MQAVEESIGTAGSPTATGATAETGETMAQSTSSASSTALVSPAATSTPTPTPPPAAARTVSAPLGDLRGVFALDPELQAEVLSVLGTMKHGHVRMALSLMRRMTASLETQWPRVVRHRHAAMTAADADVQSGNDPFERTYQIHSLLLEQLDGLGADDLFLLVRLVSRIRATNGLAPDSFEAEDEKFFAEETASRRREDAQGVLHFDTPAQGITSTAATPEATSPTTVEQECASDDESIPDTVRQYSASSSRVELDNILDGLGGDEIAVLARIAKRLEMGQKQYGRLDLKVDPRKFRSKEAREELEDHLVYLACAWLVAVQAVA
jgi:hypothetical protein